MLNRCARLGMVVMVAVAAVNALFSFSTNPLSPEFQTDSSVFYYLGESLLRGGVPYRDLFDHKGPMIYFINALGASFGLGFAGVWVLEAVGFLLSIGLMFRFVERRFGVASAGLSTMFFIWFFCHFLTGGNNVEGFATFVIVPTYFIFLKSLEDDAGFRCADWFVYGLCAGFILMLRPNMLGWTVPILIFALLRLNLREYILGALFGLAGVALVVVPCVGYLLAHGALVEFWRCYIEFNLRYMDGLSKSFFGCQLPIAITILNLIAVFLAKDKWRRFLGYNLWFNVASLGVVLVSPRFLHYYIVMTPGCVLPVAHFASAACRGRCRLAVWAVSAILFVRIMTNLGLAAMRQAPPRNNELVKISQRVQKGSSVLVIGNACHVYSRLGASTQCRYAYQSPIARIDGRIASAVNAHIMSGVDEFIIVDSENPIASIFSAAVAARYEEVLTDGRYQLWAVKR